MVWWNNHQWESSGPKILESQSPLLADVIFNLGMEYPDKTYVNQQTSNVITLNDDKTEIYGPNPGQPTTEA
jgi:hypothetical protein